MADIFAASDAIAREMAEADVRRGGVIPSPGEREAYENQRRIDALERRVRELESRPSSPPSGGAP